MDRVIRKVSCILITICMYVYVVNDFLGESLQIKEDVVIPNVFCVTYYESYSNNTGYTTINGIGNVYYNLQYLGYHKVKEEITDTYVDVCFQNLDGDVWRYYYETDTGYIIFFNSNYESSFNGVTYIIERKDI